MLHGKKVRENGLGKEKVVPGSTPKNEECFASNLNGQGDKSSISVSNKGKRFDESYYDGGDLGGYEDPYDDTAW